MKRLVLILGLVAAAALSTACAASAPAPSVSGPVDPNGPTVVAKDMKFQTGNVEVKAGENVTVHCDNQDSAPHNFAIYKDSSASPGLRRPGDHLGKGRPGDSGPRRGNVLLPLRRPPRHDGNDRRQVGAGRPSPTRSPATRIEQSVRVVFRPLGLT